MMATERASLANGDGGGDGEVVEVTGEVEVQWVAVQQVEVMAAFWRIKRREFSTHRVQSEPGYALTCYSPCLSTFASGFDGSKRVGVIR